VRRFETSMPMHATPERRAPRARPHAVALAILVVGSSACAGEARRDGAGSDDDETARVGDVRGALVAADPISAAVGSACSTSVVVGLSTQLVEEIQCLRPGALRRLDASAGIALGSSVFPYLQPPAADAVAAAQRARGVPMTINSALRTLPQQYLLYQWYRSGRCGIPLAAAPGKSNHEAGLAVDIADNAAWRTAMGAAKMRWFGTSDPVHFDFTGDGGIDLRGLSVLAFQRLWNRNHPEDKTGEDGAYGSATEQRLSRSPIGGFPKGADCTQSDGIADAGLVVPSPVPDTAEPDPTPSGAATGEEGCAVGALGARARASGCGASWAGAWSIALGLLFALSRRHRGGAARATDRARPRVRAR